MIEKDIECMECGGILNPHSSRGPYKKRHLCDCMEGLYK